MAFFRKWKTHYRHKKFKSEDATDAIDHSMFKTTAGQKSKNKSNGIIDDDEEHNPPLFATYNIKYLGCTPIQSKRSEKVTSDAIKTVISNSKAGGRKSKSLKSVILNVSQDGVEMLEDHSRNTLMRYSIYQISYCSVDAAHDQTFSFVSAEPDPLSDQEKLSCHVFQCLKRKVAHEITLMVARCFEHAYQHWRDTVVQNAMPPANYVGQATNASDTNKSSSACSSPSSSNVEVHRAQSEERKNENLLIDLAVTDTNIGVIEYLQNSWVSFDDDLHEANPVAAY